MSEEYKSYEEKWGGRAKRARKEDILQSVIDPGDFGRGKNRFIDYVQKIALSKHLVNAASVLDFGCGTGRFLLWSSSRVSWIVGIDIAREMILLAKGHTRNLANVRLVRCSCNHLPFRDESFDNVLDVAVLQVLVLGEDDCVNAANEMVRVLKTGGKAYVIEQVQGTPTTMRSHEDYLKMFRGCTCVLHKPVMWRGWGKSSSKMVVLAWKKRMPPFAFPLFGRIEMIMVKRHFEKRRASFDGDYLFVFEKGAT